MNNEVLSLALLYMYMCVYIYMYGGMYCTITFYYLILKWISFSKYLFFGTNEGREEVGFLLPPFCQVLTWSCIKINYIYAEMFVINIIKSINF